MKTSRRKMSLRRNPCCFRVTASFILLMSVPEQLSMYFHCLVKKKLQKEIPDCTDIVPCRVFMSGSAVMTRLYKRSAIKMLNLPLKMKKTRMQTHHKKTAITGCSVRKDKILTRHCMLEMIMWFTNWKSKIGIKSGTVYRLLNKRIF